MKLMSLLEGLALGAGLMFVLDPDNGRRRQAMARDKFRKQVRNKQQALGVMQRDFANRSRGMVTQIKASRTQGDIVADEIVEARVRSTLGRFCTHPRAVHCEVHNGEVTLTGEVLRNEIQQVVHSVRSAKGVHKVINNLDVVEDTTGISSLQGEGRLSHSTLWNPATGLVMTALGGLFTLYGMGKRGPIGAIVGTLGAGMVAKSFYDTEHRFACANNHAAGHHTGQAEESIAQEEGSSVGSYEGLNTGETGGITEQTLSMPVGNEDNSGLI